MVHIVENVGQLSAMLTAARAIVIVSVPWSPWPKKSRVALATLEATHGQCSPDASIAFFDLWPERDEKLNRWYESLCVNSSPRFELHGHGYGPLWWLAEGKVLECITKPYDYPLEILQQRSKEVFCEV